ncbi:MAG: hypothetical protein ACI861_000701 [Paracoccaceae bacterium]|jgi:hypothetical protein
MHPKGKNIGQVVFLSEKVDFAREVSSCCIGTEAYLETGSSYEGRNQRSVLHPKLAAIGAAFRKLIKI